MSDVWSARLSEHLDGELAPEERTELEAHLEGCAACRAELDGLRRVVARLDGAPDREPAKDLWPELSRRMEGPPAERRSRWRLAAAAAVLLPAAAGAWLLWRGGGTGPPPPPAVEVRDGTAPYQEAAASRQALLEERSLPPELDAALRADLEAFRRAIDETRAALQEHPDDADLRAHLTRTLRAQVRFLARVEASAGERS